MSSGSAAYRKEAEETQIMGSVLVIGGGAAGLAAAIAAAECGAARRGKEYKRRKT